jgi:hypothetical protein
MSGPSGGPRRDGSIGPIRIDGRSGPPWVGPGRHPAALRVPYVPGEDLIDLYKKVASELRLSRDSVPDSAKGSEAAKAILQNLATVGMSGSRLSHQGASGYTASLSIASTPPTEHGRTAAGAGRLPPSRLRLAYAPLICRSSAGGRRWEGWRRRPARRAPTPSSVPWRQAISPRSP